MNHAIYIYLYLYSHHQISSDIWENRSAKIRDVSVWTFGSPQILWSPAPRPCTDLPAPPPRGQDMDKIWTRYGQDMDKIWTMAIFKVRADMTWHSHDVLMILVMRCYATGGSYGSNCNPTSGRSSFLLFFLLLSFLSSSFPFSLPNRVVGMWVPLLSIEQPHAWKTAKWKFHKVPGKKLYHKFHHLLFLVSSWWVPSVLWVNALMLWALWACDSSSRIAMCSA